MPRSRASSGVVSCAVAPPGRLTVRPSAEGGLPISAMRKDCSLGSDEEVPLLSLDFAIQEAKVGYLMPHFCAKAAPLMPLFWKAARTSDLYSELYRARPIRSLLMMEVVELSDVDAIVPHPMSSTFSLHRGVLLSPYFTSATRSPRSASDIAPSFRIRVAASCNHMGWAFSQSLMSSVIRNYY